MSKLRSTSVVALVLMMQAGAVQADGDITLQQGKHFSLYASANCRKVDLPQVDLLLECKFNGKEARFYLKEFPRMAMPTTNLARIDTNAECERLLRLMLKDVDGGVGERIRLFGGAATFAPTVYSYYGFTYPSVELARKSALDAAQKRVLFRAHSDARVGTGMLVVISDFDRANLRHGHGVPDEVLTMFASLDMAPYRILPP